MDSATPFDQMRCLAAVSYHPTKSGFYARHDLSALGEMLNRETAALGKVIAC